MWVSFTQPRPSERLIGVFLFCFVLMGLFWGSIVGGISGALGGGIGGWITSRSGGLRWRTVVAFGSFGNLALVILIFVLVGHSAGPSPMPSAALPVRVVTLIPPLAVIGLVGMPSLAIGHATVRLRLRRAEVNAEGVRAPHPATA